MSNKLATKTGDQVQAFEMALIEGDLSRLSAAERTAYYGKVCESLGLNPLTKPFEYIKLNGRLVLYARRDCTDQLRRLHTVSVKIVAREKLEDVYVVTAQATTPDGRSDESIGAVTVGALKGDALANAIMKAETKAKRRVTLSICGLGVLDETETADRALERISPNEKSFPTVPARTVPPPPVAATTEIEGEKFPWERQAAPTPPAQEVECRPAPQTPRAEMETAGDYVIQDGSLKGTRLRDKPDAFWQKYVAEVGPKLEKMPEAVRAKAMEALSAIDAYFNEKQ